jgi:hypothetical protein
MAKRYSLADYTLTQPTFPVLYRQGGRPNSGKKILEISRKTILKPGENPK